MDINKDFLYEKTKERFENGIELLLYFLIIFDIGIIVYLIFKFKSRNKNVKSLIYILSSFIFVDIVFKILNVRKIKDSMPTFFYSIFLSALSSTQFYLILTSLETVFHATKITRNLKFFNLISIFPLSIIFFFLTFSYDKFFKFYKRSKKIYGMIQYITIIYCIYKLYELSKTKIIEIINNSVKKKIIINKKICLLILFSFFFVFFFLIFFYIIKI